MSGSYSFQEIQFPMTRAMIVETASNMETLQDLLNLLNRIKMADLGKKGYPFSLKHLKFFIHPARNAGRYKTFYIPKKSGGLREISAPTKLLKSFLTYTNIVLQSYYEGPEYVTGFVPGKSVVDNAEFHVGKNYVFNTDLKDFFPSINKSRVWATLKHPPFNFNDTIADAIAGLCCTEVEIDGMKQWVLPQGSPCSPILTNIVCRNLDRALYRLAKNHHLTYSRYADDLTFSGNRNVFQKEGKFQQDLHRIIEKQKFTINEKKTRLQTKNQRQEVTGLVVSDRVNVSRDYVRGLDNLLYIWEKYGEKAAYARFLQHYTPKTQGHRHQPDMHRVLRGKLLYLKMVKGEGSRVWRKLQRRYNRLTQTNEPLVESRILYRYRLADFEQKTGADLSVEKDSKGTLHLSFILNGRRIPVTMSKYARTRLTNLMAENDPNALTRFKSSYVLVIYDEMWRIERKRRAIPENMECPPELLQQLNSEPVALQPDESSALDIDNLLDAFVNSDFDLNNLDLWDKIKNN